jgi:hypothetical protein
MIVGQMPKYIIVDVICQLDATRSEFSIGPITGQRRPGPYLQASSTVARSAYTVFPPYRRLPATERAEDGLPHKPGTSFLQYIGFLRHGLEAPSLYS